MLEWLRAQRTRRALGLALDQWVRVGSTPAIADRARAYVARLWIHHRLAVGWRAWRELVERPRHARIHEVVAEWRTSAPVRLPVLADGLERLRKCDLSRREPALASGWLFVCRYDAD